MNMNISQAIPNRVGKRVENYVFTKLLGKGAYGEVPFLSNTRFTKPPMFKPKKL
jgi:hypothetical protein